MPLIVEDQNARATPVAADATRLVARIIGQRAFGDSAVEHSRRRTSSAALLASVAIVLSVPWIVPATMLFAVLSAPVYMWLHTQGPVPAVLDWLGGIVLIAAVAGCHINAALLLAWQRTRKLTADEIGLRDFLFRHGQHK